MSRQAFRRCTRCTERTRLGPGERHCLGCGGSETSWGFVVGIGPDPVTGKRRRRRGGGFATRREVHVILHRALEDAVRWDELETPQPGTAPSATAARNERRRRIRTWTAQVVNTFAAFIKGHEFHELLALAGSTGLRRSELLALRWIDLDLGRRLLSVRRVLVLVGGKPQFEDAPKSAHGFRTISIPPGVSQLLVELRTWQAEQPRLRAIPPEEALVFCRPDGDAWHPDHVTSTMRELMIASGLPRIRPMQDLRHTHATLLIGEGGVNVKVVEERLGHHSHSLTADTYQHVIPGMDAAADRFDELVFGQSDTEEDPAEATAAEVEA